MDKIKPRAIIFDLGSTLIEYETIPWDDLGNECLESGRRFLLENGYELPAREIFEKTYNDIRDAYRRQGAETLIEWDVPSAAGMLFDALDIAHDEILLNAFFDAYYQPVERKLFIYQDALQLLKTLKPSYPVMGLISNTVFPERAHLSELQRFGIAPFLKFTVFSSTFGLRKPHPDIFYSACNLAGFAPSECLYVGDRYMEDVLGPTKVGMHAVLKIIPGREYPADMPEFLRKIDTLLGLLEHVEI